MTMTTCATCGAEIDAANAYMSEGGEVCGNCHVDSESSSMKSYITATNIAVVAIALGGVSCTLNINGIEYGSLVMAALATIVGVYTLVIGLRSPMIPAWLRYGRPAVMGLVAIYNLLTCGLF